MIDYRTIIYMADGIGLLLQVMILISGRTGRNVRSSTTRLYYLAVVLNMILCALDFPVFYFDGLRTGYTVGLLYVLNTVQALLLTCMTYVWFRFVTRRAGVRDDWRVFRMVAPIPLFRRQCLRYHRGETLERLSVFPVRLCADFYRNGECHTVYRFQNLRDLFLRISGLSGDFYGKAE